MTARPSRAPVADAASDGRVSEQIDSDENTAEGYVDQDGSAGTREG